MFKVVAFFTLLGGAVALTLQGVELEQWQQFKAEHNKSYASEQEESFRASIFLDNLQMVEEHNDMFEKGLTTYTMKINKFSDLLGDEHVAQMTGLLPDDDDVGDESENDASSGYFEKSDNLQVPDLFDWREKGAVTEVMDQGFCLSSWAFSATGSMEGQMFVKTGQLVSLSEQNLMDCDKTNRGCFGGSIKRAFAYVKRNGGLDSEASYHYQGKKSKRCRYNRKNSAVKVKGFKRLKSRDEETLKQAIATQGPISVSINVRRRSFQHYSSGVYNNPKCSQYILNHAALAVGYGTENGQDYWLVKNSWGASWGESGYIKMSRNKNNQCGIATRCSFPLE